MKLGNTIREYRNYTQEYMAQKLGMSITAYGKIERDLTEMTFTRLHEIAQILDIDIRQILDFDEKNIFNVQNGENAAIGNINTVHHNNILVEHLKEEIAFLREEVKRLLSILEKK